MQELHYSTCLQTVLRCFPRSKNFPFIPLLVTELSELLAKSIPGISCAKPADLGSIYRETPELVYLALKSPKKTALKIVSASLPLYVSFRPFLFFIYLSFRRRKSRVRVIKVTRACRKLSTADHIALVSRVFDEDEEVSQFECDQRIDP